MATSDWMRSGLPLVAAVSAVLVGCSPPPSNEPDDAGVDEGADVVVEAFELQLGVLSEESGAFVPIEDLEHVEIVVGFQGLIFIDLALRTTAPVPDRLRARADVVFRDASELNFDFRLNQLAFESDGDGRICKEFQVPFGQDLPLLDEERIFTDVELSALGWKGSGSAEFLIADRDPCIHGEDGEPACE